MDKTVNWRKILNVLILGFLCFALVTGCSYVPNQDTEKKPSKSDSSSSKEDNNSTEQETEDDLQGEGWFDQTGSTDDSEEFVDNTDNTDSSTSTDGSAVDTGYTTLDNGLIVPQKAFVVDIPDYNPGIPGYDIQYTVLSYFNDLQISNNDVIFSCDVDGITFENNKITIPEEVNNSNTGATFKFVYKNDPRYFYEAKVQFKHWEPTLLEEFDEFNNDLLKVSDNSLRNGQPTTISQKDNVYVKDGKLVLEAKSDDITIGDNHYTQSHASAHTSNLFEQKFGCFTASIKMPDEHASLSAFWILPSDGYGSNLFTKYMGSNTYYCQEVDIIEAYFSHEQNGAASNYTEHFWDSNNNLVTGSVGNSYKKTLENYVPGSFHEYTWVWTENASYNYVDGVLIGAHYDIRPDDQAAYILFNVYSAPTRKYSGETINGMVATHTGWFGLAPEENYYAAMEVDWLHVYK